MKKSIFRNLQATVKENLFKDQEETIWVSLKGTNTLSSNYDPYRQTGQTVTLKNPYPIKAMVRHLTAESLVMREIGLKENGAIELLVDKSKTNFFRIAQKIEYNAREYSLYIQALGNKVQITPGPLNYDKVVLFLKGNK